MRAFKETSDYLGHHLSVTPGLGSYRQWGNVHQRLHHFNWLVNCPGMKHCCQMSDPREEPVPWQRQELNQQLQHQSTSSLAHTQGKYTAENAWRFKNGKKKSPKGLFLPKRWSAVNSALRQLYTKGFTFLTIRNKSAQKSLLNCSSASPGWLCVAQHSLYRNHHLPNVWKSLKTHWELHLQINPLQPDLFYVILWG